MLATKRVAVTEAVWAELSNLRRPGETFSQLLADAHAEDPFPGQGDDKELLHLGYKLYRLHIGRSFTVFYQICEEDKLVKILEITTIDKAHKLYKRLGE